MADEPADTETRLDRLERKLDELLAGRTPAHAAAEQHEEKHLDRPSTIEEQVRAELKRAEQEKAKADADEQAKSEQQTIREQLAKLTESKPVAPQPRRQRVMWGPR
jgi:hypothetical protein